MKIFDDGESVYIINNFNDIVLSIPYYIKTEYGIEEPYANDKEGAMELATAIIENFIKEWGMRSCVSDEGWDELQKLLQMKNCGSMKQKK